MSVFCFRQSNVVKTPQGKTLLNDIARAQGAGFLVCLPALLYLSGSIILTKKQD
jgi:hypothetical protein